MCGIIGYLGEEPCFDYLITGLKLLQNRGYDSAGISTINSSNQIITTKFASNSNETSIDILEKLSKSHSSNFIGIGHTRWATHGSKSDLNAHPHNDSNNLFSVVHNGIIENYTEIKEMLEKSSITLVSQTDTEVIPKLFQYFYEKQLQKGDSFEKCTKTVNNTFDFQKDILKPTIDLLKGSWAILVLYSKTPDKIYVCKNGSPVVIGVSPKNSHKFFCLISSETSVLSEYYSKYISLNDGDILCIQKKESNEIIIDYNEARFKEMRDIPNIFTDTRDNQIILEEFPHYTLKEIYEQPFSILRTLDIREDLFKTLEKNREKILSHKHLILLGCGTSLNSANVASHLFRNIKCFSTVQAFDASEMTMDHIPFSFKEHSKKDTLFILLSQSGETKDVHKCLEMIKKNGYMTISLVNVFDSLIYRESDLGIYLNAGLERAVASTKSFTSQIIGLTLLSRWFESGIKLNKEPVKNEENISYLVKNYLENNRNYLKELAKTMYEAKNIFVLGRGIYKCIADECALKIKEICYIHCESFSQGALKHGPFALLDAETIVILFGFDEKTLNTIEEISSRGSRIILITTRDNPFVNENIRNKTETILIPSCIYEYYQCILSIIPLQLLAYEISILKGINPDYPRNLAKVVTVDG